MLPSSLSIFELSARNQGLVNEIKLLVLFHPASNLTHVRLANQ